MNLDVKIIGWGFDPVDVRWDDEKKIWVPVDKGA